MKRMTLSLIILIGLFAVAQAVTAKSEPYVEEPDEDWGGLDNAVTLPVDLANFLLAGRLNPYGDIDAFTFMTTQPLDDIDVHVVVPVCGAHFASFYPSVALIGPGLPSATVDHESFSVPEGMGMVILANEHPLSEERSIARDGMYGQPMYRPDSYSVDLTEAGEYTLILWEPDGHIGAYLVEFRGSEHALDESRSSLERERRFTLITSGRFMDTDCKVSLVAEECPPTPRVHRGTIPSAPQRSIVGRGYVLTGVVRDADTCLPIAGAHVRFEMANPEGNYDDEHVGVVTTNQQGGFRIESDRPGMYGSDPHIHLLVSASGYQTINALHTLTDGEDHEVMPIALRLE